MEVLMFVAKMLETVRNLLLARGDADREQEVLMQHQENLKEELDRRKFGL